MFESVNHVEGLAIVNWNGEKYKINHCVEAIQRTLMGNMIYAFYISDVEGFCKTWLYIPKEENKEVLFVGYHSLPLLMRELRSVDSKEDFFEIIGRGMERDKNH
jgi:hypothetical protein